MIRPGRPDEAAALARLHLHTALTAYAEIFPPEAPAPDLRHLQQQWARILGRSPETSSLCLVATAGGAEPVGVVVAGPDPGAPDLGHLSRLYVTPAWWSRGLGRRLHDGAVEHLRRVGYAEATLWVLEGNVRARTWYERLGWRLVPGRKPTYAPAGIDDVRYQLDLRRAAPVSRWLSYRRDGRRRWSPADNPD